MTANMTPSVLLYTQAVALLQNLQTNFSTGVVQSPIDIANNLRQILAQYQQTAGQPILNFDFFLEGEPPLSAKLNNIWQMLQYDVTILQNEIDVLQAATVFTNNFLTTELLNEKNAISALANKLDTLELFSNNSNVGNLVVFSDNFGNSQLIDTTFLTPVNQATINNGLLTLATQGSSKNLSANATVTILNTSNGFAGNNQEIEDPLSAPIDPTRRNPLYQFIAETYRAGDTHALLDGRSSTWFEYEYNSVFPQDRATAQNLNFTYQTVANINGITSQVDWATGPPNNTLELDLQFDLGSVQSTNSITYTPYGLENNNGLPVLVKYLATSEDGTTWTPVTPANIYIGTNTTLNTLRTASNIFLGTFSWFFEQRNIQYVQISLLQSNSITANIGHLYYTNPSSSRVEGPVPTIVNPAQFYDPNYSTVGSLTQNREYFIGKRWAIGISDFLIQQNNYQTASSMVTVPLTVNGIINRVALDAVFAVPPDFPVDQSWVSFYVTPDNGQNWFPIAPIQDDALNIPEVIAFNDPLPSQFREAGVAYYNISNTVNSVRLRIDLTSPSSSETPSVSSYALKATTR